MCMCVCACGHRYMPEFYHVITFVFFCLNDLNKRDMHWVLMRVRCLAFFPLVWALCRNKGSLTFIDEFLTLGVSPIAIGFYYVTVYKLPMRFTIII